MASRILDTRGTHVNHCRRQNWCYRHQKFQLTCCVLLVELFCLIFSFETFSYNSSWQKSLFKHLNEWKISMFYNHEILMFKDCWEKKFSIENILESVRPAEKGKRSTYKEESKMKTTKFMFICGVVNAVRRYSKEFPTINKYHEWIVILSKVDVVLWALIIEISFVNQFLNNWLKNILFYRVWFKRLFWYILLCADLFIPVYICCFFYQKFKTFIL